MRKISAVRSWVSKAFSSRITVFLLKKVAGLGGVFVKGVAGMGNAIGRLCFCVVWAIFGGL